MNLFPNRDGVVRQIPLFFRFGDRIVPSLAAEALRVAQGASTYILKSSNASGETAFGQKTGLNSVRIGDIEIATDAAGALTLKFRQSNPSAFIPAWKLLAGEVDESQIAGRIILIGTSTPGLLDLRATPLDAALPGVEIQAQIIEHILAGRRLTRPDYALAAEQCPVSYTHLIRKAAASLGIAGPILPICSVRVTNSGPRYSRQSRKEPPGCRAFVQKPACKISKTASALPHPSIQRGSSAN